MHHCLGRLHEAVRRNSFNHLQRTRLPTLRLLQIARRVRRHNPMINRRGKIISASDRTATAQFPTLQQFLITPEKHIRCVIHFQNTPQLCAVRVCIFHPHKARYLFRRALHKLRRINRHPRHHRNVIKIKRHLLSLFRDLREPIHHCRRILWLEKIWRHRANRIRPRPLRRHRQRPRVRQIIVANMRDEFHSVRARRFAPRHEQLRPLISRQRMALASCPRNERARHAIRRQVCRLLRHTIEVERKVTVKRRVRCSDKSS